MNAKQLKQFIESQVFDILTGIKDEIQNKIKDIDSNILMIKKDIHILLNSNTNNQTIDSKNHLNCNQSIEQRFMLIQKQIMLIKQNHILSLSMNPKNKSFKGNNNQAINMHNSTSQFYQNTEKQLQKTLTFNNKINKESYQSNISNNSNSPSQLFKRTSQNSFDLNSVLFDDLEDDSNQNTKQNLENQSIDLDNFKTKNANISLNQNTPIQQYKNKQSAQFTLTTKFVPTNNTSKIVSPLVNKSKQKKPPLPMQTSNNKSINSLFIKVNQVQINRKQLPTNNNIVQKVQKELSKNKNSFLRKKSNGQNFNLINEEQVQVRELEQTNIELQYSKDSIDGLYSSRQKRH